MVAGLPVEGRGRSWAGGCARAACVGRQAHVGLDSDQVRRFIVDERERGTDPAIRLRGRLAGVAHRMRRRERVRALGEPAVVRARIHLEVAVGRTRIGSLELAVRTSDAIRRGHVDVGADLAATGVNGHHHVQGYVLVVACRIRLIMWLVAGQAPRTRLAGVLDEVGVHAHDRRRREARVGEQADLEVRRGKGETAPATSDRGKPASSSQGQGLSCGILERLEPEGRLRRVKRRERGRTGCAEERGHPGTIACLVYEVDLRVGGGTRIVRVVEADDGARGSDRGRWGRAGRRRGDGPTRRRSGRRRTAACGEKPRHDEGDPSNSGPCRRAHAFLPGRTAQTYAAGRRRTRLDERGPSRRRPRPSRTPAGRRGGRRRGHRCPRGSSRR